MVRRLGSLSLWYSVSMKCRKRKISIRDNQAWEESAEQYLNLVKISDDAFKDLLSYYKKESEPTIVVMFGDHEPRLGDSFYSALKGRNSDKTELQRLTTDRKSVV